MNSGSINKTFAILCYCTLIGWIISVVQVSSLEVEDRKFTAFHLRQMLILMLVGAAVSVFDTIFFFIPFFGLILIYLFSIPLFICWLMLLISAVRGKRKTIPLIGQAGENMLGDMFE